MQGSRKQTEEQDLQSPAAFLGDPAWFFRRIIMPLLPKEATFSFENDGVMEWKLLSDTIPIEDRPEYISQRQSPCVSIQGGGLAL
jgi:hypothetical protein